MQEDEENQSAERRIIPWMDGELEVEQKENRGWEGILYRRLDRQGYILAFLEWRNGGYLERFRPIYGDELAAWLDAGKPD